MDRLFESAWSMVADGWMHLNDGCDVDALLLHQNVRMALQDDLPAVLERPKQAPRLVFARNEQVRIPGDNQDRHVHLW